VHRQVIEHCEDILGVLAPKKFGAQNNLFLMTSQLNGNFGSHISSKEHDIDNQETALETMEGPLTPTSSQNFINFVPLTAENGAIIFNRLSKIIICLVAVAITLASP